MLRRFLLDDWKVARVLGYPKKITQGKKRLLMIGKVILGDEIVYESTFTGQNTMTYFLSLSK
jgi:hypothetical protein